MKISSLINSHAEASAVVRDRCRLCDREGGEVAFSLGSSPIADRVVPAALRGKPQPTYPLDLYFCHHCGHLQLTHALDPEVLFGSYTYVSSSSLGLIKHFRVYAKGLLERFAPASDSLVVEIGSNDGSLLKNFKDAGLRVVGVDPAVQIAEEATAAGLLTLGTFFTSALAEQLREEHGAATLVCANNVFAHADDLRDIARGVAALLEPQGVFVFEVSYLVHIIERLLFDTIYHEHTCYHNVKPLALFFDEFDMELFDVEYIPTKGGSIRCFAQRKEGGHEESERVRELIAAEEAAGYDHVALYRGFGDTLARAKEDLLALLRGLKKEGKRVAGYGASHTVTTLAHCFGLDADLIEFVVDDNAEKQGMYSPGFHVPIVGRATLEEEQPDFVVILAWQYALPIVRNNAAYLAAGGRFIVPLPAPQMVERIEDLEG